MYSKLLNTKGQPLTVDLDVSVPKPSRVRVQVINPNKPNTVYFDRWKDVVDKVEFEIKMPQNCITPRLIIGCTKGGNEVNVSNVRRKKLATYPDCIKGNGGKGSSTRLKEAIKFIQEFSENAGVYGNGSYYSDKRNFRIDYVDVISEQGKALTTPARIHNETGRIEVARRYFLPCTVPSRDAILFHEFSHFNLNEDQHDEIEADLNALKIYLGLGYPVIEAHKGFLGVFKTYPSPENRIRYEYLKNFIDNFEQEKFRICL